jgi:ABC-type multidrug transport system fused ATPase/permease subunit
MQLKDAPPSLPMVHPPPVRPSGAVVQPVKIDVTHMNFYYGANRALDDITLKIHSNQVTALIGPSASRRSSAPSIA